MLHLVVLGRYVLRCGHYNFPKFWYHFTLDLTQYPRRFAVQEHRCQHLKSHRMIYQSLCGAAL